MNSSHFTTEKQAIEVKEHSLAWYALKLREHGFAPIVLHFPIVGIDDVATGCSCRGPKCQRRSWGKHPRNFAWAAERALFLEPEKIAQQFTSCHPHSNIGTVTGLVTGNVIIDVDVDETKDGRKTLARLEELYGALPPTPTVLTGSGGLQYHLRHTQHEFKNSKGKLGLGIDIRGKGGQGVLPQSRNANGVYRWAEGRKPSQVPIAELPPRWVQFLLDRGAKHEGGAVADSSIQNAWNAPRMTFMSEEEICALEEYTHDLLEEMMEHPLIKWMLDEPNDVSEEVWRSVAVNLALPCLGLKPEIKKEALRLFHTISKGYDNYSSHETTRKFISAMTTAAKYGPLTFQHMMDNGAPEDACDDGSDVSTLIGAAKYWLE